MKPDACVVTSQTLSQGAQTLKDSLYRRTAKPAAVAPPLYAPMMGAVPVVSQPMPVVLPGAAEASIEASIRETDAFMRAELANRAIPTQILMQQATALQTMGTTMKEQNAFMAAQARNAVSAEGNAYNQQRLRYEVAEDNRRLIAETLAPLNVKIATNNAQILHSTNTQNQLSRQIIQLKEILRHNSAVQQADARQRLASDTMVTQVALERAGMAREQPMQSMKLEEVERAKASLSELEHQLARVQQLSEATSQSIFANKIKAEQHAIGGTVAQALAQRDRRIEGLLGTVFNYSMFDQDLILLENDFKKIQEAFSSRQKPEISPLEPKKAFYDYTVPEVRFRGRTKEVEARAKKIPKHLRQIITVPEDCVVQGFQANRATRSMKGQTILDQAPPPSRPRTQRGAATAASGKPTKREELKMSSHYEEYEESRVEKKEYRQSSVERHEFKESSQQRRQATRGGPTELLKLREEDGVSLPTQTFDERMQASLQFDGEASEVQAEQRQEELKSEAILRKARAEMQASVGVKHAQEEKLVDLLTDQILHKMLQGQGGRQALDVSTSSNSGQLVRNLIRELESKGLTLDQFLEPAAPPAASPAKLPTVSVARDPTPPPPPQPREERKSPMPSPVAHVQPLEQSKEDFLDLIAKKTLHQRKAKPRVDIHLEDEKLKLEAEEALLHKQVPINAAPFMASVSAFGVYQNPFALSANPMPARQGIAIGSLDEYELSSADGMSEIWGDDSIGGDIKVEPAKVLKARLATLETNKRTIESEPEPRRAPRVLGNVMASTESFGMPPHAHAHMGEGELESGELPDALFQRKG